MILLNTIEERYRYLQLKGAVGSRTFGSDRYLNQVLYSSPEWKRFRHQIIIRDNGCSISRSELTKKLEEQMKLSRPTVSKFISQKFQSKYGKVGEAAEDV